MFFLMPRWLEITLTLLLFAIGMAVIGWFARLVAPSIGDWLAVRIGEAGIWMFFILLWITGGVLLYREKTGKAGKAVGK